MLELDVASYRGGGLTQLSGWVRERKTKGAPTLTSAPPNLPAHFKPSVCQALKMGTPAREVSRWNRSGNFGGSLVQLTDKVQLDKFQINVILNRSSVSCHIKCVSFKDTKTIARSALTLIFESGEVFCKMWRRNWREKILCLRCNPTNKPWEKT